MGLAYLKAVILALEVVIFQEEANKAGEVLSFEGDEFFMTAEVDGDDPETIEGTK